MIVAIVVIVLIIVVIAGACFFLGLIPGTNPYHKKKLNDGYNSLECGDLLLSPLGYNKKVLVGMGNLLEDEDDADKIKKAREEFDKVYVTIEDKELKKAYAKAVKDILDAKVKKCKEKNKDSFKTKYSKLPTDLLKGMDQVNKDNTAHIAKAAAKIVEEAEKKLGTKGVKESKKQVEEAVKTIEDAINSNKANEIKKDLETMPLEDFFKKYADLKSFKINNIQKKLEDMIKKVTKAVEDGTPKPPAGGTPKPPAGGNNQNTPLGNNQNTPGNNQNTPGNNQNTPGNNQNTPGNNQNTPGNNQNTPGNNQNTPLGNNQNTPGNNENTPGNNQNTPSNNQNTPSNNQNTPSNNQNTPGNNQNTPGNNQLQNNGNENKEGFSGYGSGSSGINYSIVASNSFMDYSSNKF